MKWPAGTKHRLRHFLRLPFIFIFKLEVAKIQFFLGFPYLYILLSHSIPRIKRDQISKQIDSKGCIWRRLFHPLDANSTFRRLLPLFATWGQLRARETAFSESFVQSARLNQRSHSREDRLFFNPLLLSYRSYVKPLARQSKWDSNTRDAGPIDQIIRDLTPHLYPLNGRQDAKADSRAGSAGKVNYLLYYSITQRSSLRKSHLLGWKNGQRDGAWVRFK